MKTKISQLRQAKQFLATHHPAAFTPDGVCEQAGLTITPATLARKFRQAATGASPELHRTYYKNSAGEQIAQYAWRIPVPVQELLFKGGKEICP